MSALIPSLISSPSTLELTPPLKVPGSVLFTGVNPCWTGLGLGLLIVFGVLLLLFSFSIGFSIGFSVGFSVVVLFSLSSLSSFTGSSGFSLLVVLVSGSSLSVVVVVVLGVSVLSSTVLVVGVVDSSGSSFMSYSHETLFGISMSLSWTV